MDLRFEPSGTGTPQRSKETWTVDVQTYEVVKAILDHEIKENIVGKLKIQADEERIVIDYNEGLSSIRHGQVATRLARFIGRFTNHPGKPTFWHPWFFDWRGRMYTSTTMLSAERRSLPRSSVWEENSPYRIRVCLDASSLCFLFRDIKGVGTLNKGEEYLELIAKLADKSGQA